MTVKENVAILKTDIKYIREAMKTYGVKIDSLENILSSMDVKVSEIEKQMTNHIHEHAELKKEMLMKWGLWISAMNIIISIIMRVFGV